MAGKVSIAIGIKRVGNLPELPGAVNGAKDFAAWAEAQGYVSHLLTDEAGAVKVARLKELIKGIVDGGETERLLLYFAGHGMQPTYNTLFWLLSDWEADSDEAVNVMLSCANAGRSGIRQIALFSDACRSVLRGAAAMGGASIFPRRQYDGPTPHWDKFYATRLDEDAQEVNTKGSVVAHGLFSKCVMQALSGKEAEAIRERPGQNPGHAVTSEAMADYLEAAVPDLSGRTPGALVQFPDVSSGWRAPLEVYLGLPDAPAKPQPPIGNDPIDPDIKGLEHRGPIAHYNFGTFDFGEGFERIARRAPKPEPNPVLAAKARYEKAASDFQALLESAKGRENFETRQGFTVIGAKPKQVVTRQGEAADLFEENGAFHIRGHGGKPQTVMIELEGGNWVGVCILPMLVGTLLVNERVAASINYIPAQSEQQYLREAYEREGPMLRRWAALMRQGRAVSSKELHDSAEQLRNYKHVNPSFGVMAAYAYEQAGEPGGIDSITEFFARVDQAVPFDIALLSSHSIERKNGESRLKLPGRMSPALVAGAFPLMTQGWVFLDREDAENGQFHPDLLRLRSGLLPSMWTSLRPAEGGQMADMLAKGEL